MIELVKALLEERGIPLVLCWAVFIGAVGYTVGRVAELIEQWKK